MCIRDRFFCFRIDITVFVNTFQQMRRSKVGGHNDDGIDENGDINPEAEELVMNELRGNFRPEFLNRLDEIIMFKPLTRCV